MDPNRLRANIIVNLAKQSTISNFIDDSNKENDDQNVNSNCITDTNLPTFTSQLNTNFNSEGENENRGCSIYKTPNASTCIDEFSNIVFYDSITNEDCVEMDVNETPDLAILSASSTSQCTNHNDTLRQEIYLNSSSESEANDNSDQDQDFICSDAATSTTAELNDISQPSSTIIHSITSKKLTETEKIQRNTNKHPFILTNLCNTKCNRQCTLFSNDERRHIWESYWNLRYEARRKWLAKCVRFGPVQRRRNNQLNPSRNETRYFFFQRGSTVIVDTPVCRTFFLKTLGYTNDRVITELSKMIKKKSLCAEVKENRGGVRRTCDRGVIEQHIDSFHPAVSHYRRLNSPNMRYLPSSLTVKFMYNDFKNKHPNICSIEIYRQTMKKIKVSLHQPKSDICTDCLAFKEKLKEVEISSSSETIINNELLTHKTKADKAIRMYKDDCTTDFLPNTKAFSMDLQKTLVLPIMPSIKDAFFISRLVAFNLTFGSLKKLGASYCVLWHEAIAGRDAKNIVDAILKFIEAERDVENFIIWADNCAAQNKNWILYTSLVSIVNTNERLSTINIRYLTKGHTHMTADGIHGNIENAIKRERNIYDFSDYKKCVLKSRTKLQVLELSESKEWPKKKRALSKKKTQNDPLGMFRLNPVVEVMFTTGSRLLKYKYDFDEQFRELDFLPKTYNILSNPSTSNSRGISSLKKQDISSKLLHLMPENRRIFWQNLPLDDAMVDLNTDGQLSVEEV